MVTKQISRVRELDKSVIQQRERELEIESRKRKGLRRRLSVLALISVVLACLGFVTIYSQAATLEEKHQEKIVLQTELDNLKKEELRLHEDIKNYNDLDFIAEVARRDYYLSKPGETLFKLPNSTTD